LLEQANDLLHIAHKGRSGDGSLPSRHRGDVGEIGDEADADCQQGTMLKVQLPAFRAIVIGMNAHRRPPVIHLYTSTS